MLDPSLLAAVVGPDQSGRVVQARRGQLRAVRAEGNCPDRPVMFDPRQFAAVSEGRRGIRLYEKFGGAGDV